MAEAVFNTMAKKVSADIVSKVNAIYRFDLKAGGNIRSWIVDLKNGSGKITEVTGKDDEGECTVAMSEEDFIALINGDLDGQSAFLGGQLTIKGDMMLAMKLEELSALK